MSMQLRWVVGYLFVMQVACDTSDDQANKAQDTTSAAVEVYQARCAVCHGPQGRGDGPSAAALDPAPRDFSEPSWQRSVSDQEMRRIISQGGAAVGKSAAMPAAPDLADDPKQLDALIQTIRSFEK